MPFTKGLKTCLLIAAVSVSQIIFGCADRFPVAGLTTFYAPGPPSYIAVELYLPSGDTLHAKEAARKAEITIARGDPWVGKDGLREFSTEVIGVEGSGYDSVLGEFHGNESPRYHTTGRIKALTTKSDFPADFSLGIYAELEFTELGIKGYNREPFWIRGTIHSVPPIGDSMKSADPDQAVLLYDYYDTSMIVGKLTEVYVYPTEERTAGFPTWVAFPSLAVVFLSVIWLIIRKKKSIAVAT